MIGRALAAAAATALALVGAMPAAAQEAWAGLSAHAVDTPVTAETGEGGIDLQAGYRFAAPAVLAPIGRPQPYLLLVANLDSDTSLAAAGLSWRLGGGAVYARPGIGLAVHDGPRRRTDRFGIRTDLGSRVLFEPELAVGVRLSPRLALEASWIHVSHAQLFSRQNPGLDIIGARLVAGLR